MLISTLSGQPALANDAAAGTFDYEALKKLLKDNKHIKSVDDVIPLLPESYKKNYTVAYKSRSRQGGVAEAPRVIAFGAPMAGDYEYPSIANQAISRRNDHLIIAFKTDPAVKVGLSPEEDDLEVFEWIPARKGWAVHDITFPNRKSGRPVEELADEERYALSIPNPPECRGCHRYPEVRPNWESYPRWPGFFGSNAGPYYSDKEKTEHLEEKAALKLFAEKTKDLPRFKMLAPFPYADSTEGASERENINIRITSKLGRLNFKRVQRIIEGHPEYSKLKYAVFAGLARCENFPSFLSESLRTRITLNYDELYTRTFAAMATPEFHYKIGGDSDYNNMKLAEEAVAATNMRYLFEGGLDQKIDPWFMNVARDQFRANAVGGNIRTDVGSALASAAKFYTHPRYREFDLNLYVDVQPAAKCAVLRELSLDAQQGR